MFYLSHTHHNTRSHTYSHTHTHINKQPIFTAEIKTYVAVFKTRIEIKLCFRCYDVSGDFPAETRNTL